ncbi:NADPH:quinone oxidoreductase family protein [Nocardioides marmoriginsengisoli]|uniref:NADPH:quinone oxidoreductase family protein n=1 Tax=Nocardioides marmoriginsengisoli TaxID=661483 RepID=A0A3N0CGF6_9ACTN|nr:NADPH:quinone oxidoreductase family protein [Nocardioides marmoriginsengisoli]RNL62552.1 NADPH:quinone oxidoreductase family protein [Nocardioides marmoriginsengisoli]
MRALQVTRHGDPIDVLAVNDIERPAPGPGEVLIRTSAAALNYNDILRCQGGLVSVTQDPPFTLGMDLCGVVEAAGAGAESWTGQRVLAVAKDALGGLAEYVVAPAAGVFAAPAELTDTEAAAFLLPFHTTYLALHVRAGLGAGETLLVHSGASGLGTAAIKLGVAAGARVLATVSSPEKAALCRSLGADLVIDHTAEDWVEAVLSATGDAGADVILDLAGGEFVGKSWTCVARGGRYLPVGFTDDPENGMSGRPLRMISIGNFSVVGVVCAWVDAVDPGMRRFGFNPFLREEGDRVHAALTDLVTTELRPHVGRVVSLDEAGAALEDHLQRRAVGRTVVRLG